MKKLFFVFVMAAFAATTFASENGCVNKPGVNDGKCMTSTVNGQVNYYCVDTVGTKDCVKGGDVDEG